MVNTNKAVGFYTDVFGNEITEYEQTYNYTVWYKGNLFYGDKDGINEFGTDSFNEAMEKYNYCKEMGIEDFGIRDNEYGVDFVHDEWY